MVEALEPIKARGALETVRRLVQRINEIMIYAVNTGLIDANPASGIGMAFEKPKKQGIQTNLSLKEESYGDWLPKCDEPAAT